MAVVPLIMSILALTQACLASPLSFDYIIIGGGTSGLAVASRLSELSHISVAVIEAGGSVLNNSNVTKIDKFTLALGTDIDWNYESTPQIYAGRRNIAFHGGKALGGTSTINGMTYVRAEKSQIDSWELVGNKDWNWDSLLPYYEKSEQFTVPTMAQSVAGASFVPEYHGEKGLLKVGYAYALENGSFIDDAAAALKNLGLPRNLDVNGGSVRGFTVWPATLDREANVREDAARAYYYPFQQRPNLHVFLNTTANNIIWKDSEHVIAEGVEIASSDGTVSVLKARKEVIVSAGSLRSPAILEFSGIGNPRILEKFGIPLKVDLQGVGENLQDQPLNVLAFQSNTTFNGMFAYAAFGSLSDISIDLPVASNIQTWASTISASLNGPTDISTLTHLLQIQHKLLSQGVPDAELVIETTVNAGQGPSPFVFSPCWLLMPFSRGNIHITSKDPKEFPALNPNFFVVDFDLDVQVAAARWARKFWNTEPLRDMVVEISPGLEAVPANATDDVWREWVKTSFSSNSHPIATASMMSRELGGVVDGRLKVYGTKNVRVVDASVMPFQVSGHLTSTLYAIAEKAADMIKEDI